MPQAISTPPQHTTIAGIAERVGVAIKSGATHIGRADAVALIAHADHHGLTISLPLQKLRADDSLHYPAALVASLVTMMSSTPIVLTAAISTSRTVLPSPIPLDGDHTEPDEPLLKRPTPRTPSQVPAAPRQRGKPKSPVTPPAVDEDTPPELVAAPAPPTAGADGNESDEDDGAELTLRPKPPGPRGGTKPPLDDEKDD